MFMFALVYTAGIVAKEFGRLYGYGLFATCVCIIFCECFTVREKVNTYRRRLGCFVFMSIMLFFTAQARYSVKSDFRDSYMQYMTDDKAVVVWGKITKTEYKNGSYRFYLSDCTVAGKMSPDSEFSVCGSVILYCDEEAAKLGDYVRADGNVKLFSSATNEGEFDRKAFYSSQGIDFGLKTGKIKAKLPEYAWFYHGLQRLRDNMSEALIDVTDGKTAGVLSSMLLGDKAFLDEDIKDLYQVTGISHILAISGLHISIVGVAFYRLLRRKGAGFFASFLFVTPLILSYAVMTGNAVSTKRAVGMFILTMLAAFFGRTGDMLNSLGFMVMVILWDNPFTIGYTGFIFSVVAILGIGIVVPFMISDVREKDKSRWLKLSDKFWSSVAIQLPMLPVVAMNYYEIPLYAVFVNLLVIPLLPVIFISGLFASVAGCIAAIPGKILVLPAFFVLRLYEFLCRFVITLPGADIITGSLPLWKFFVFYTGLMIFIISVKVLKRKKDDKKQEYMVKLRIRRVVCTVFLMCVLVIKPSHTKELDVLDVGQGDGIFYRFDSGCEIFIDGGSTDKKQVGQNIILPFLKYNGVSHISYWFVSHADNDHISGLAEVLESGYQIEHIVVAETARTDEAMAELIKKAHTFGVDVIFLSAGDVIEMTHVNDDNQADKQESIVCLYPGNDDFYEDRNDMCLSFKLTDGDFSGIFAGDIPSEIEQKLVSEYGDGLKADFYKADHHGSKYSSSTQWLEAINPKWTAVSCAKENRYGHPADEAVNRIEAAGSRIFYTMESGQIKYKESAIYENNR